jgi:hypothetical protein
MDERDRVDRVRDHRRDGPNVEEFLEEDIEYELEHRRQLYFQ